MLDRAAAVAVAEVELAVEPEHHAVHAVVGVDAAEPGQERDSVCRPCRRRRCLRARAGRGYCRRRRGSRGTCRPCRKCSSTAMPIGTGKTRSAKTVDLVGLAVAVGVFEDLDLVGLLDAMEPLVAAAGEPIVQPLGDPDPAARVDVDIGGVDEQRLGRPERRLEPRGRLEPPGRLLGADLRNRARGPERQDQSGEPEDQPDPGGDRAVGSHGGATSTGSSFWLRRGSPTRRAHREAGRGGNDPSCLAPRDCSAVERPLWPGGTRASRVVTRPYRALQSAGGGAAMSIELSPEQRSYLERLARGRIRPTRRQKGAGAASTGRRRHPRNGR